MENVRYFRYNSNISYARGCFLKMVEIDKKFTTTLIHVYEALENYSVEVRNNFDCSEYNHLEICTEEEYNDAKKKVSQHLGIKFLNEK